MRTLSRMSLLVFLFLSVFPAQLYAARPFLAAERAAPIERGMSELEVGYEYARFSGSDDRQTVMFSLTHGLINNLDFEVEVPTIFADFQGDHQSGLGDLRLKSKLRFIKGREANPLSISGQVFLKFPTCDDDQRSIQVLYPTCTGEVDVGLVGIASKSFSPVTVHLNLGYTFVGNPPGRSLDDTFLYDLAFEYETGLKSLVLVAELMGEVNQNIQYSGQDPLAFLYGLTYKVVPNLQVDGAFSAGLTEGSADYTFTVGWIYGF